MLMKKYEYHPACLCLPKMADDEFNALRASISAGYDKGQPIVIHEDKILDGRHRYEACELESVEPTFTQFDGGNPFVYVRNTHEARRSWKNQEQKVLVIGALHEGSEDWKAKQKEIQAEANRKRSEAAKAQSRTPDGTRLSGKQHTCSECGESFSDKVWHCVCGHHWPMDRTSCGNCQSQVRPQCEDRPAPRGPGSAAKAQAIGVTRAAVERAEYIKTHNPEAAQKVAAGDMSASQAVRETRKQLQQERLAEVASREIELPTGLYDVIVVDPPWPMEKIERDVRPNQVAFDYPTMTEAELADLHIPADRDCHVWLWTTHRFLPMALRLLDAWNLKYVCTFVWHKPGGFQPIGLPQYNSEFALYARAGSPSFIDTKALPTCFDAPRGKHSEKPEEFYETIRRVTGGRRLDMFNRREIDGFVGWGKES
jgi:N6-adenosine-specific RNA methylase IME4